MGDTGQMQMRNDSSSPIPRLHLLSPEQAQAIHSASLQVLQRTGYHVPLAEARSLLSAGGARAEGSRVYIPPTMVERALGTLRPVTLFNRLGQPVLPLAAGKVSFGASVDSPHIIDPVTRRIRPFSREDQSWFTRVLDELPNIDWIICGGQSCDVPDELQIQVAVLETVRNTTKPIVAYPYDLQGLLAVLELMEIVAGGKASLQQHPSLIIGSVPAAPLCGTDYNLQVLMKCAQSEVPLLYFSCPAAGANSPCDLTGIIVAGNADWLGAVVLHQLVRPGAPLCNGGFSVQVMDMRTTVWSYSAPEVHLACAAIADLAHWYGMPAFGMVMEPDTPYLDAQAGAEMTAHCIWAFLSDVQLVRTIGRTGAGKLVVPEAAVLANEIIGYVRASMRQVPLSQDALAEASTLIDEVGPLGNYVAHEHTLRKFRDFWYPSLFQRDHFDPLAVASTPPLLDALNTRLRDAIENHMPPSIPADVEAKLAALERKWYATIK